MTEKSCLIITAQEEDIKTARHYRLSCLEVIRFLLHGIPPGIQEMYSRSKLLDDLFWFAAKFDTTQERVSAIAQDTLALILKRPCEEEARLAAKLLCSLRNFKQLRPDVSRILNAYISGQETGRREAGLIIIPAGASIS